MRGRDTQEDEMRDPAVTGPPQVWERRARERCSARARRWPTVGVRSTCTARSAAWPASPCL